MIFQQIDSEKWMGYEDLKYVGHLRASTEAKTTEELSNINPFSFLYRDCLSFWPIDDEKWIKYEGKDSWIYPKENVQLVNMDHSSS